MRPCNVTGCPDPSISRGYCARHYQRWRKYGNALITKTHVFETRTPVCLECGGPIAPGRQKYCSTICSHRRAKRLQQRRKRPERICACGCGRPVPMRRAQRKFFSNACCRAAWNARMKQERREHRERAKTLPFLSPTMELPGSEAKIAVLRARLEAGRPLFNPMDGAECDG